MLDDLIQNATVEYDGDTFTYRQACAKWETECFSNDILNLDQILEGVRRIIWINKQSTIQLMNLTIQFTGWNWWTKFNMANYV